MQKKYMILESEKEDLLGHGKTSREENFAKNNHNRPGNNDANHLGCHFLLFLAGYTSGKHHQRPYNKYAL